jgi:hypothetical protein
MSPVRLSVTVPFPQSVYRFDLSPHGPAALSGAIRADGDIVDARLGPAGLIRIIASASIMVINPPTHLKKLALKHSDSLRLKFPILPPIIFSGTDKLVQQFSIFYPVF